MIFIWMVIYPAILFGMKLISSSVFIFKRVDKWIERGLCSCCTIEFVSQNLVIRVQERCRCIVKCHVTYIYISAIGITNME